MEGNKYNNVEENLIIDYIQEKCNLLNNNFSICLLNNKLYKIPCDKYNKLNELKNIIDSFLDKDKIIQNEFLKKEGIIKNIISYSKEEKEQYIKEYNELIYDITTKYNIFENFGLKVETKNIKIKDKIVEYYIDDKRFNDDTLKLPDTLLKGIEILIQQKISGGYIEKKTDKGDLVVIGFWSLK